MYSWKYTTLAAVTAFALTSLIACEQNKSLQIKSGSVVSDGVNVTSQSTLGGYQMNVAVMNIGAGAGTSGTTSTNYNYSGIPTANPHHFDLLITSNAYSSTYSYGTTVQPISITIVPTIYNPTYSQWYGQTSTASSWNTSSSGYYYMYDSKCSSQACEVLYLNIIIQAQNGDTKQIGIKKSIAQNRVLAVTEVTGTTQNVRTTEQIIVDLNAKSSL